MKNFLLSVAWLASVTLLSKAAPPKNAIVDALDQRGIVEQEAVNYFADQTLKRIDEYLLENRYDPLNLPDEHSAFNYTIIINYHGGINLSRGHLEDLATMHRRENVVVVEESPNGVYVGYVPVEFQDLRANYEYSARIMGLGTEGGIDAYIKKVRMQVIVEYNNNTNHLQLLELQITDSGHIDVVFNGNALIDWLFDLMADAVTGILRERFWQLLDDVVAKALTEVFDEINLGINPIPLSNQ